LEQLSDKKEEWSTLSRTGY